MIFSDLALSRRLEATKGYACTQFALARRLRCGHRADSENLSSVIGTGVNHFLGSNRLQALFFSLSIDDRF
jgi:hypothetical protein